MAEFYPISEDAIKAAVTKGYKRKYPWIEVPAGQSFVVPRTNVTFAALKVMANKAGKKCGKKFVVVDHGEAGYEVANMTPVKQPEVPRGWGKTSADLIKNNS